MHQELIYCTAHSTERVWFACMYCEQSESVLMKKQWHLTAMNTKWQELPADWDATEAGHSACLELQLLATCLQRGIQDDTIAFVPFQNILFACNVGQLGCGTLCIGS